MASEAWHETDNDQESQLNVSEWSSDPCDSLLLIQYCVDGDDSHSSHSPSPRPMSNENSDEIDDEVQFDLNAGGTKVFRPIEPAPATSTVVGQVKKEPIVRNEVKSETKTIEPKTQPSHKKASKISNKSPDSHDSLLPSSKIQVKSGSNVAKARKSQEFEQPFAESDEVKIVTHTDRREKSESKASKAKRPKASEMKPTPKDGKSNSDKQNSNVKRTRHDPKHYPDDRNSSDESQPKCQRSSILSWISPLYNKYRDKDTEGSNGSVDFEYVFHKLL